jgi:choline-sulfatase
METNKSTQNKKKVNKNLDRDNSPNILIIVTDQHRADLMTCAERKEVQTPNIDRIAENGIRFTNAYCSSPVCVPSRMSLLTGLYAHSTGVINNNDQLDWRYRTIAHQFAEAGYITALIGKMHFRDANRHGFEYYLSINDWLMYLGPKTKEYASEVASHPLKKSTIPFDEGAGFPDVADLWKGATPWIGHVKRLPFDNLSSKIQAKDHLDMFIARESAKFIRRYKNQQFLLVAGFMKPHTPLFPPKEYADRFPIDEISLPNVGSIRSYPPHIQRRIQFSERINPNLRRAHIAGYFGNLAFVDDCIGIILDTLKDLSLEKETIIVYTSDHGEMLGDHGLYQKFCMFEQAIRVPLIVSYPKKLPRNKETKALTEYIGLYPTVVDLADIKKPATHTITKMDNPPKKLDLDSFLNTLQNPINDGPSAVFCEYNLRSPILSQYMIRTKKYKYIHNSGSINELYDLEADPQEYNNRIDDIDLKETLQELRKKLYKWFDPAKNPFKPKPRI